MMTETAKSRVLRKYPSAEVEFFSKADGFNNDSWDVFEHEGDGAIVLGSGATEGEAWEDAAKAYC